MDTTHSQTNGKSTLVHVSQLLPAPIEPTRSGLPSAHPRYMRVLDLVRDAVDLDLRLKQTMTELDREMREVGNGDLSSVLVSLMKHHQQASPQAETITATSTSKPTKPSVAKAKHREKTPPLKNRGGMLKAKLMGLMSDGKERKSLDIVKSLGKAKNPSSVYSALSAMAEEGHLIRTRFAHYRLKMRKG